MNAELGRLTPEGYASAEPSGVAVVLDNIRSALNVGSAFRSSDAFKVDRIVLCGICAVPPSAEIHKSALGAEDSVPWEHVGDTLEAVARLRRRKSTSPRSERRTWSRGKSARTRWKPCVR